MKLVYADSNKANKLYFRIEQPMPIYHSTEELYSNEKDFKIVKKSQMYDIFMKAFRELGKGQTYIKLNKKIFINTEERYIPDSLTQDGFIIYKLGKGLSPIKTDTCYIRAYGLIRAGYNILTSTGIWTISDTSKLSAGVPPKIDYERNWNLRLNREVRSKSVTTIIDRLKNSGRLQVHDYKFIYKLFNPLAGNTFLNPIKAGRESYKVNASYLSKDNLVEILSSQRVQKLILKELNKIMPELAKAIQDKTNPESIANFLQTIATDAISNEDLSVEEKLLSVQAILNAGYPEEGVVLNPPKDQMQLPMLPNQLGNPAMLPTYEDPKIIGGNEVEEKPMPMSQEDFDKGIEDLDILENTIPDIKEYER